MTKDRRDIITDLMVGKESVRGHIMAGHEPGHEGGGDQSIIGR